MTHAPSTYASHAATQPIYLDYNATTPLDPAVVVAMRPFFEQQFGEVGPSVPSRPVSAPELGPSRPAFG